MAVETLTFATKRDAYAVGFEPARCRTVERYRGGEIYIADVSGWLSWGYRFAVKAALGDRILGTFALSQTVWFREEKNRLGYPGAAAEMFTPEEFERALQKAREAIDKALDGEEVS